VILKTHPWRKGHYIVCHRDSFRIPLSHSTTANGYNRSLSSSYVNSPELSIDGSADTIRSRVSPTFLAISDTVQPGNSSIVLYIALWLTRVPLIMSLSPLYHTCQTNHDRSTCVILFAFIASRARLRASCFEYPRCSNIAIVVPSPCLRIV
jgi:hypothetical protein